MSPILRRTALQRLEDILSLYFSVVERHTKTCYTSNITTSISTIERRRDEKQDNKLRASNAKKYTLIEINPPTPETHNRQNQIMSRIPVEVGVKKFVCIEPNDGLDHPKPVLPLSKCKACSQQKKRYGAYYNAAAHLRRAHFKPKATRGGRKNDFERRGGKGGGNWPPLTELKHWMKGVGGVPRMFENTTNYRRKMVGMYLNDTPCFARPDTGSDRNIISAAFAADLGVEIHQSDNGNDQFVIGNGQYTESIGKAFIICRLPGGQDDQSLWFHVMAKCSEPVIVGFEFVREVELYTKNKHLLVDCPSVAPPIPSLTFMGSPKGRVEILADGKRLEACVDTGSDLDLMSINCTLQMGFHVDRSKRNYVMLADQTIVETLGQVRVKSIELPQFDPPLDEQANLAIAEDPTAEEVDQAKILSTAPDDEEDAMIFHVLENLVCDVILGEEFLEQMDAFNTCGIIERESDDFDSYESDTPLYTPENFRSSVNHQNMSSHQYSFANHEQPFDCSPVGYLHMAPWLGSVDTIGPALYPFTSLGQSFDVPQFFLPMEPFGQSSNLTGIYPSLDNLAGLSNPAEPTAFRSLNPFVNLGPVQSFLNTLTRKNKLKHSTTDGQLSENTLALARQDHAESIEAEMYRHNNAERLIERMKNHNQKVIAQKAENAKREAFQKRHVGCAYCTGVPISSSDG